METITLEQLLQQLSSRLDKQEAALVARLDRIDGRLADNDELMHDLAFWAKRSVDVLEGLARELRDGLGRLGRDIVEGRGIYAERLHEVREALHVQLVEMLQKFEDTVQMAADRKDGLLAVKVVLDDVRARLWELEQNHGATESLTTVRKFVDFARLSVHAQLGGRVEPLLLSEPTSKRGDELSVKFRKDGSIEAYANVSKKSWLKIVKHVALWAGTSGTMTYGGWTALKHLLELVGLGSG